MAIRYASIIRGQSSVSRLQCPETRRAICEAERDLGDKATRRLRDLCDQASLNLRFVACACQPGTEGTPLAITEGVAALSKQMVVTSALS